MSLFSMVVVYILVWWLTLFAVLPIGVRGQAENNSVVKGTDPGAPVESRMKRKIVLTTLIAALIWAIICGVIMSGWIDTRSIAFF